ncbi:MAG: sensory box/GGDEF family protein [Proteobacteria bacterium]|nr:sensory box/GGDEF family protein [Pseudomonadota bacterium]
MAKPSDHEEDWDVRKDRIIGLGERSFHKSYYPQLRQNLDRLERFRTLIDRTSDFVILIALPEGIVVDANATLGRLLGEPVDKLIGQYFAGLGLVDATVVLDDLRREMGESDPGQETPTHALVAQYSRGGLSIWLELSYRVAIVEHVCYGVLVGRDISERKHNQEMMAALLAEKEALLENALVGIVLLRQRQIVTCNRRFEEIFGYPPGAMLGQSTRILYPGEEQYTSIGETAYGTLNHSQSFSGTLLLSHADGTPFWGEITGRALDAADPLAGSIWIFSDITERKAAEDRVKFLAYHDALTGLPNVLLVQDRLQQAISLADSEHGKLALMVVDLDRFKTINDSLGHSIGDQLLVAAARRLNECVRESDTICRQGGDEFLILLPKLADPDASVVFLAKLMVAFLAPFRVNEQELTMSISVGVAVYPDDGLDFDTLLKKADMAMYRAKDAGRNTYRFFNEEMNEEALDQLTMHFGLRRALDKGQFVLHYQPQIEISSRALVGAEALIRWNHPDLGLVPPGRFIPAAEESGLIVPIGDWVLRAACREAARWQQAGLYGVVVAVNLSALQFKRGDIEQSVRLALEESGLDPSLLELELTESILIGDTESVLSTVMRLKHMGVKLSIDDFGTGYSSLSYLKRFKVDKLKIDQSFVRHLASDAEDAVIVRAVIQMARSLGLRTIAEGVEDQQVLDHLRLYHCDEAQGYFFSRPVPAAEFIAAYAPAPLTERG